jgi:hypothetical protein
VEEEENTIPTANRSEYGNEAQPVASHYNISQPVKEMEIHTKFILTINVVQTNNYYFFFYGATAHLLGLGLPP